MAYQFKNIIVLVVESSESMFSLTKSVLITFGVNQVYSAYNAEDGFSAFCKLNPDLIIMDWLESKRNGLDLTREIRTHADSPNPFVPIILMTGYSQKKRVLMARDSGITEFLVKPYTAKALFQRIEQLIERPRLFVRSSSFFGPDRRRKGNESYTGPERRTLNQPKPVSIRRNSDTASSTETTQLKEMRAGEVKRIQQELKDLENQKEQ